MKFNKMTQAFKISAVYLGRAKEGLAQGDSHGF